MKKTKEKAEEEKKKIEDEASSSAENDKRNLADAKQNLKEE